MLLVLAGSILTFTMVQEATVVEPFEKGQIVIEQDVDSSPVELRSDVRVELAYGEEMRVHRSLFNPKDDGKWRFAPYGEGGGAIRRRSCSEGGVLT